MTIERYKRIEDLSPAEHDRRRYGDGQLPETDEYRAARRKALERAGLEHDDPEPGDLESLSADDHARRRYGDAA